MHLNHYPQTLISYLFYSVIVPTIHAEESPDIVVETASGWTIHIDSEVSPLRINQIHSWRIEIRDSKSALVPNALLEVEGGMPDHNHGLPTQPRVTAEIAPGTYLLQGVRFHMPGRWRMQFIISTKDQEEIGIASFEL